LFSFKIGSLGEEANVCMEPFGVFGYSAASAFLLSGVVRED
jgi:hypothetical protein